MKEHVKKKKKSTKKTNKHSKSTKRLTKNIKERIKENCEVIILKTLAVTFCEVVTVILYLNASILMKALVTFMGVTFLYVYYSEVKCNFQNLMLCIKKLLPKAIKFY